MAYKGKEQDTPSHKTASFTRWWAANSVSGRNVWISSSKVERFFDCRCLVKIIDERVVLDGAWTYTFTIVTTDANDASLWIHDRQPVMLTQDQVIVWLDRSIQEWTKDLQEMLAPYSGPELVWWISSPCCRSSRPQVTHSYAVPAEIGKVGTESEYFLEPVESRKDGIEAMFSKQMKQKQLRSPLQKAEDKSLWNPAKKSKRTLSDNVGRKLRLRCNLTLTFSFSQPRKMMIL